MVEAGAGWSHPARSSLRTLRDETKAVMQYVYPRSCSRVLDCQSANRRGMEGGERASYSERAWAGLKHQLFCLDS